MMVSILAVLASVLTALIPELRAQERNNEFFVSSFKALEMDLDARLHPEIDENGKKAALVKVVTGERGFSFDVGIMGIVGIRQEVGEIWVYIPENVRRMTIRHKDFGVIRDYEFGVPVVSACVYELVLHTPERGSALQVSDKAASGIVPAASAPVTGIAIPSLTASGRKTEKKWFVNVHAGIVPDFSAGLMAGRTYVGTDDGRGFGWYLKGVSDFRFQTRYDYECLGDGTVDGEQIWTKQNGHTWKSRYSVTGGMIWKCLRCLGFYAGLGAGQKSLVWEDSQDRRVRVKDWSYKGMAMDAGAMLSFGRWNVSAGVSSITGGYYGLEAGFGVCF